MYNAEKKVIKLFLIGNQMAWRPAVPAINAPVVNCSQPIYRKPTRKKCGVVQAMATRATQLCRGLVLCQPRLKTILKKMFTDKYKTMLTNMTTVYTSISLTEKKMNILQNILLSKSIKLYD